jgi:hypothetical protein
MIGHFLGGEVISARAIAGSALVLISTIALMKSRHKPEPAKSELSTLNSRELVEVES